MKTDWLICTAISQRTVFSWSFCLLRTDDRVKWSGFWTQTFNCSLFNEQPRCQNEDDEGRSCPVDAYWMVKSRHDGCSSSWRVLWYCCCSVGRREMIINRKREHALNVSETRQCKELLAVYFRAAWDQMMFVYEPQISCRKIRSQDWQRIVKAVSFLCNATSILPLYSVSIPRSIISCRPL